MSLSVTDVSPDLLRAVFDHSLTSIYAARAMRDAETGELLDFQIYFCNPAFCERARRTEAEVNAQPLRTLFPTLVETGFFDRYRQVVETGVPFEGEQEYPGPNGHFWYQTSVKKWEDGIIVNFIDITERKQAELQVQQANDQLEATLDASISSILAMTAIRDEAGQIVDFRMNKANRAVERSLGKTPAELEGRTLLSVYPGNVESGFFGLYAKAADTGEPQQATFHYTDVNGYEGWFEASAVRTRSAATAPDQIVLTFMNVTEYKQAERLVQQQADLVNSVLNATLTGVATYEPVRDETGAITDFRFTLANQASLAMLGLPAEVLYTKTLCELNPPLRGSAAFDRYVAVVETGEPVTMDRLVGDRWFLVSAVRFDRDGLLTSSIDITETKQARQQLAQLNEQLQRSNESLDQFAYVASHDLQEPLRKIRAFGDLLADQYGPALGDGVDLLGRMQSAANRMQTLIRDLLAYSRLAAGGQTARQPVNLTQLVGEVLQDLEVAIAEKEAVVDVGTLPTLPGDPVQLRQVVQNLLSNALKFTKPGQLPRLTVSARSVGPGELPAELRLSGPAYWLITVADNGIGFGAQYRERIFGAFERLHGRNSAYDGSGIGLAIVRRVMDNHHGAVVAQSAEGEGATFTLYLPAAV